MRYGSSKPTTRWRRAQNHGGGKASVCVRSKSAGPTNNNSKRNENVQQVKPAWQAVQQGTRAEPRTAEPGKAEAQQERSHENNACIGWRNGGTQQVAGKERAQHAGRRRNQEQARKPGRWW